jgi:hypothetical protein
MEAIAELDFDLGYVVIDKSSVKQSLRQDPSRLYRFLVVNYVITNLVRNYEISTIHFVVDKSMSKASRENFDQYVVNKVSWREVMERGNSMPSVKVDHVASDGEECLQIADYCSGAAFAKFERGNPLYYDMLVDKVKFRSEWGKIRW